MRNRRPGSIADRIFCAKSHCRFHIQPLPPQRGRVRFVGAPTESENIEEKSVSDMVAPGASPSGDQPISLRECALIAA